MSKNKVEKESSPWRAYVRRNNPYPSTSKDGRNWYYQNVRRDKQLAYAKKRYYQLKTMAREVSK